MGRNNCSLKILLKFPANEELKDNSKIALWSTFSEKKDVFEALSLFDFQIANVCGTSRENEVTAAKTFHLTSNVPLDTVKLFRLLEKKDSKT